MCHRRVPDILNAGEIWDVILGKKKKEGEKAKEMTDKGNDRMKNGGPDQSITRPDNS